MDFTILVVDDDPFYRETLVTLGKKLGYNIVEAKCGNEAFNIIQSQPIAGLITDLRMPNGTGIELMERIRNSQNKLPQVPKIVVNSGMLDGGETYLRSLGASHVFVKPVKLRKLLQT